MRPVRALPAAVALLVLVTACGGGEATLSSDDRQGPLLHTGSGTVIERAEHGPELCLGPIASSLPPQCRGVPLVGWQWDAVSDQESAAGTTWGSYSVTGTFDGKVLTVTEPAGEPVGPDGAAGSAGGEDPFATPCPEPPGGWVAVDPARTGDGAVEAANAYAMSQTDLAAFWVDHLAPTDSEPAPDDPLVLNAAFTGDLERHEAELRKIWGGPLCVGQMARTTAELRAVQQDFSGSAGGAEFGLQVLWSGTVEYQQKVEVGVVAATDAQREAVDGRYGEGTVELVAGLNPVG